MQVTIIHKGLTLDAPEKGYEQRFLERLEREFETVEISRYPVTGEVLAVSIALTRKAVAEEGLRNNQTDGDATKPRAISDERLAVILDYSKKLAASPDGYPRMSASYIRELLGHIEWLDKAIAYGDERLEELRAAVDRLREGAVYRIQHAKHQADTISNLKKLREAIRPIAELWEPGKSPRLARGDMINIVRGALGLSDLETEQRIREIADGETPPRGE